MPQRCDQITYTGQFFWVFVYLWPVIFFFYHNLPALGPSPTCVSNYFPRWIPVQRPMVGVWHHLFWGSAPSFLTPKESFCTCVAGEVFLTSRMRNTWSLCLLFGQDSAPPCSCHCLYLRESVHSCSAWGQSIFCLVLP